MTGAATTLAFEARSKDDVFDTGCIRSWVPMSPRHPDLTFAHVHMQETPVPRVRSTVSMPPTPRKPYM